MRLTAWQVALTVSATTHAVAALGLATARPGSPPAGLPAARRVQLTVAAPARTTHAARMARLLPEPPPTPTPETFAATVQAVPRLHVPPVTDLQAWTPEDVPVRRMGSRSATALPRAARGTTRWGAHVGAPAAVGLPAAPSVPALGGAAEAEPAVPVAGANAPPPYPAVARRNGWEGTVLLDVRISTQGTVQRLTLAQSTGHAVLDAAASTAVRQWRFTPARVGGRALASTVRVPIVFRLADARG